MMLVYKNLIYQGSPCQKQVKYKETLLTGVMCFYAEQTVRDALLATGSSIM